MSLSPIIIFVYNRADHFMQTYNALAACKEAKQSELYIFSDGAKNEAGKAKVDEVRAAVDAIKNAGDFKAVTVTESPVNRGLAASIIAGVTEVINKHGKVIVVEDDCKVSPYFLTYINGALDYYQSNKKIGSIAGYTPMIDLPDYYKSDVFAAYRSCSCTWATWADRWEGVDWKLKDMGDFYRSSKFIRKLNANGSDRFIRLYRQTKGNGSSWSVRFGAHLVKRDLLTVYPRYSYITNIGCDESGVHSKADDAEKMRVDLSKAIAEPVFAEVEIDKKIQKILKKHYSYGFVSDLKKLIATVLIVIKERLKG